MTILIKCSEISESFNYFSSSVRIHPLCPVDTQLEKVRFVFEFFEGRFGFLRSQVFQNIWIPCWVSKKTLSETFFTVTVHGVFIKDHSKILIDGGNFKVS